MAKIEVNLKKPQGSISKEIFGHFCEHAFKNIYGGIYDPESKNADIDGYRKDVLEYLIKVNPGILRYPGGNFVSNYHWEDGVGPKKDRKKVFEYAWLTEESNQFGTIEFITLCRKIGADPYLCVNMGSGSAEEAMHWVEYCNSNGDTYYANLRRSHGFEEPFHVKYWGLGNEMYGEWQLGYKKPETYAESALEYAKAMKWVDPGIKLVACGCEQDADWNYTIMKRLSHIVDYLSAHHYSLGWGPFTQDNYLQNMLIPNYMERQNKLALASAFAASNGNGKQMKIAWDEWNMFGWRCDNVEEDSAYTLQNAIVTASVLNMFIRNCNTIGLANYSTFVNISGALSVKEDTVLTRSQYSSFELISNNTGDTLYNTDVYCDNFSAEEPFNPIMALPKHGINLYNKEPSQNRIVTLPYIDAVATMDSKKNCFLSLVNRDPENDIEVEVYLHGGKAAAVGNEMYTIYNESIKAANTVEHPNTVAISSVPTVNIVGDLFTVNLKKHSVNLLKIMLE